jgi:hypothetical protein
MCSSENHAMFMPGNATRSYGGDAEREDEGAEVRQSSMTTPSPADLAEPPRRGRGSKFRRRVELSWVVTIVLFTIGRLVLAAQTLEDYGLNIWIFGLIDLATAIPYAVGVAKVVEGFIDRRLRAASTWAVVACVSFLAPYLYIFWVGKDVDFPPVVYVVLGILIAIFGGNAVRGIVLKVREARASQRHPSDAGLDVEQV